jgi:hypothetical protein
MAWSVRGEHPLGASGVPDTPLVMCSHYIATTFLPLRKALYDVVYIGTFGLHAEVVPMLPRH